MRLDVHVFIHDGDSKLDQVLAAVASLSVKVDHMDEKLAALQAEVTTVISIEQSAVTLINGIADRIAAAGTDPAALQALTDSLKASSDTLAAAVAANTPAAPQA